MVTTFEIHNFVSINPDVTKEKVLIWLSEVAEDRRETFSDCWGGDFDWDMNVFDPQEYGNLNTEFPFAGTVYVVGYDVNSNSFYTDTSTDIATFDLRIFRDGVELNYQEAN